jgi:hypothetical protein
MNETNKMLLADSIEAGNDDFLKSIREGFTQFLPVDQLCDEDQVICGIIDDYFKLKSKVERLIEEKITIENGHELIEFEYDYFKVSANVFIKTTHSPRGEFAPESYDCNINIIDITIKINV